MVNLNRFLYIFKLIISKKIIIISMIFDYDYEIELVDIVFIVLNRM